MGFRGPRGKNPARADSVPPVWVLFLGVWSVGLFGAAVMTAEGDSRMTMEIRSSAFAEGGKIPREHTCDGRDRSPELSWTEPPSGTVRFALVADDPDAPGGTWVHWVIYNIPRESRGLPAGVPAESILADGSMQGINDFRKTGYGGPCPPPGKPHRYYFRLLAIDREIPLRAGATRKQLMDALRGHIVGQAECHGLYGR